MEYKKIQTSAEVYAVIMAKHKDNLKVFSSYSAPDGDHLLGNASICRMFTEWGFEAASIPTLGVETTWKKDPVIEYKRVNEKSEYWLCIGIDED